MSRHCNSATRKRRPTVLPIDDTVRNGRYHAVTDNRTFAVARWRNNGWEFATGVPVGFEPTGFYPGRRG